MKLFRSELGAAASSITADPVLDLLFGSMKHGVSRQLTRRYSDRIPEALVRRAVDDAAELARGTGFPHLFFPALADEKVRFVSEFLAAEAAPARVLPVGA